MTYIKPETVSKVKAVLDLGTTAAQQQDWLEVSNCLKALPQAKNKQGKPRFIIDSQEWQIAFDLALEMLMRSDFQDRWEVAKIMPQFGTAIIAPLSTMALDETVEPEVRWFICQIIGYFPQPSVVLTLVRLLQQTSDDELIAIAGKTLIKIGDNAVEALVQLVRQPEYSLLAAKSLSYIRSAATIAPLIDIASHENSELRAIAINALGSFRDRRITPVLIAALEDRASMVRKEAAIALGFRQDLLGETDLVGKLQPLLYDLHLDVCRQAAVSLGRMRQTAATNALGDVLRADTTPPSLKSDLVEALGWSQLSSGIDSLERALNSEDESIGQKIITTLGRTKEQKLKPQAVRVLIEFWERQKPCPNLTKQNLATALGALSDRSASPVLEQLAADGDRKVKLHAMAALKNLRKSSPNSENN